MRTPFLAISALFLLAGSAFASASGAALSGTADGTASVTVTGDVETAFEGSAYYTAVSDEFAVMALATAPLDDQGGWAIPEGEGFDYVEIRMHRGLRPGEHSVGGGDVSLTFSRWDANGETTASLGAASGTLTIDSVDPAAEEGAVEGTLSARLVGPDPATGEQIAVDLEATFTAVPGRIPPP